MQLIEMIFKKTQAFEKESAEDAEDMIDNLTSSYRLNGQIIGSFFPAAESDDGYHFFVTTPEPDSLNIGFANKYVRKNLKKITEAGLEEPDFRAIGYEYPGSEACSCPQTSFYYLWTTYMSISTPLHCGICFRPVPLYRLPPTYDDSEYTDIITWLSNYQACERLYMNSSTGERFAKREMSEYDSSLSKHGIGICKKIRELTAIQVYYYLYRYTYRSLKTELNRKCPGCGSEWLLKKPLNEIFDFKCDRCLLISNISWHVQDPYGLNREFVKKGYDGMTDR